MISIKKEQIKNTRRMITFKNIDKNKRDELLCLYPEKEILIERCKYYNKEIIADLIPMDIEYALVNPDYYTAEQILKALSQMAYLLAGLTIVDMDVKEVDSDLYEIYLEKLKSLKCYFTELNFRFKKKLSKKELNRVSLRITQIKQTDRLMISKMEAMVGNGFTANLTLVYV